MDLRLEMEASVDHEWVVGVVCGENVLVVKFLGHISVVGGSLGVFPVARLGAVNSLEHTVVMVRHWGDIPLIIVSMVELVVALVLSVERHVLLDVVLVRYFRLVDTDGVLPLVVELLLELGVVDALLMMLIDGHVVDC